MFFWNHQKSNFTPLELHVMADAVRALSIDQIQAAQSGHPGAPLGMADVITTLFANHLRFNPNVPNWPDRDRFVLSMGHASAMLYATLHLAGYDVSIDDLRAFRQLGARTQGHPEYGMLPGIETSTGPLGQGLANAVGMALAAKIKSERRKTKDEKRVYCMCSDGDLMEGISQEAISFAGHYGLDNLIVMWDDNGISIDGPVATSDDMASRFLASGWATIEIDGLNPREIDQALHIARGMKKPVMIACKTRIGYLSEHAGTAVVHGAPLAPADAAAVLQKLGRDGAPFTVQPAAAALWESLRDINTETPAPGAPDESSEPERVVESDIFENLNSCDNPESTRKIFGRAIKIAMENWGDKLIGGSADLTPNNDTRPDNATDITPRDARGNYIHYGVREHGMAAIMNGLALSGFQPYGGTFLVFSDYMRPAIRMSAMMKLPVIYVFTHDSIALGEDGATHQPVEQLASLRLIPNLNVMRPCNAAEVAVCLEFALRRADGPTALVLSRQEFQNPPNTAAPDDIEKGGYVIKSGYNNAQITIIATGAEVALALDVQKILEKAGRSARVVSMPCDEIFRKQPKAYQHKIIKGFTYSIEAGVTDGWGWHTQWAYGMTAFGAGGRGDAVYKHFGFDAEQLAARILLKFDEFSKSAQNANKN
ncbi:MAG: transketolase [Proteobacteria bacterium]|nr:transketolase [Pseudomonadota bacterium]